jgi:S-DNA-T family DNA segregation ATPase FtsK/SpoIIIE
VLDGRAQPALIENPCLVGLLDRPGWPSEVELRRLARAPAYRGGFDVYEWYPSERPRAVWLGQELSVRGQAMLIFRRRAAEHALVVGAAGAERYGMLAAILAGSALNYGPDDQRYVIVDRGIPEAPWSEALRQVYDFVLGPAGFQTVFAREDAEIEALLGGLLAELDRRRGLDEQELGAEPSIFVVMAELDRVAALRRRAGAYGLADTPLGERLARLYAEGGPLGMHLVLSFGGLRSLVQVIDERRGLFHFRHRVALQMAEDDSYTFVRSREAALLQAAGPKPVCGLYVDAETGRGGRFKPYSWAPDETGDSPPLAEQLRAIGAALAERTGVAVR